MSRGKEVASRKVERLGVEITFTSQMSSSWLRIVGREAGKAECM